VYRSQQRNEEDSMHLLLLLVAHTAFQAHTGLTCDADHDADTSTVRFLLLAYLVARGRSNRVGRATLRLQKGEVVHLAGK
jgi:hypothetical protein